MTTDHALYVLRRNDDARILALSPHCLPAIREAACAAEGVSRDDVSWHAEAWQRCPSGPGGAQEIEANATRSPKERDRDAIIDAAFAEDAVPEGST